MSKFSASEVAFSGFRLVRENLKSVAIWGGLMTVATFFYNMVTIHFFGPKLQALSEYFANNANSPDVEEFARRAADLTPMMLWTLPYSLVLNGVLFAGINRLVLRHQEKGFAHLGFGLPEARQAAIWLLVNLVVMGVFGTGFGLAEFLSALGGASGAVLALLIMLATFAALVYLPVRLSMASAATFDTGKITFVRSTPLTKGLFWPLLGAYFLAVVMCVIVFLLLMVILSAATAVLTGDIGAGGRVMHADSTSLKAYLTPLGMVQTVISTAMSLLVSLIIFSPAPTIYKTLRETNGATDSPGGW
jgi:hypothetical protein